MNPLADEHNCNNERPCFISPHPNLLTRLQGHLDGIRSESNLPAGLSIALKGPFTKRVGLNDGCIFPGAHFPLGTSASVISRAALERAPLRGKLRVAVVLVDFEDKKMAPGALQHFNNLFFSGEKGSAAGYYADASKGKIEISGQVVGPFRLSRTLAEYANNASGMSDAFPNARTMAADALTAVTGHLDLTPFDNDGNGYVDAFVVVHAGTGAEESGSNSDIWSLKWVLPEEKVINDKVKVFGFLTVPENAQLGVCVHELGHLLFGWPDLYDIAAPGNGVGDWCVMGSGSWGGEIPGSVPTHPSAWCKANQGWVNVVNETTNRNVTIVDVKKSGEIHRLWRNGEKGNEYFLVENRPQTGYDASLPGAGLQIWHIDDSVDTNANELHYKVALEQADGLRQLEFQDRNRGDAGDSYPGTTHNDAFAAKTNPNSKSYQGINTAVSITHIPKASESMNVRITVKSQGHKALVVQDE